MSLYYWPSVYIDLFVDFFSVWRLVNFCSSCRRHIDDALQSYALARDTKTS